MSFNLPLVKLISHIQPDIQMLKLIDTSDNSAIGLGQVIDSIAQQSNGSTYNLYGRLILINGDLAAVCNFNSLQSLCAPIQQIQTKANYTKLEMEFHHQGGIYSILHSNILLQLHKFSTKTWAMMSQSLKGLNNYSGYLPWMLLMLTKVLHPSVAKLFKHSLLFSPSDGPNHFFAKDFYLEILNYWLLTCWQEKNNFVYWSTSFCRPGQKNVQEIASDIFEEPGWPATADT
ncbi:hypothetical protein VP01_4446g1 [Puccinia sorghi]|uniref:DUF6589 domain-containing protein n=1 Tax=Puccinia sorghi TaxID=27349 RepID=A0A0L6UQA2_9BASI|nr:hypothetical protein VP01_4446g1 [Puccinia sorghi]